MDKIPAKNGGGKGKLEVVRLETDDFTRLAHIELFRVAIDGGYLYIVAKAGHVAMEFVKSDKANR